jgi:glucose/mannose-6-phosphate isomerase
MVQKMNLNDASAFSKLDPQDMLSQINDLPDQLLSAWEFGLQQELPDWKDIHQVLIAGMGGSAIGADLLASYAAISSTVPIFVHRDYDLPAWAKGPDTLVIASSHSGNTEETVSAFKAAIANKCRCLVVSTGGKLAQLAADSGLPVWIFKHDGQPRAAVGFSFGLLLAVISKLHLIPDPDSELRSAVAAMKKQQSHLLAEVPVAKNLAKRFAGQLIGRWVTVIGSGILSPVARRWKGQISEIAKAWSQFEYLPEADHNTLAGVNNPEPLLSSMMVLFLRASTGHPRNLIRSDLTRKIFMLEGLSTDFVDAQGITPLENLWTCLHLGDYVSYYLAMAYGVDPTPVEVIENFKVELRAAE